MSTDNWINAANALGTFLAVVLALWVAIQTSRRSATVESVRARLVAASIASRMSASHARISSAYAGTIFLDIPIPENSELVKNLAELRRDVLTPIWEPSDEVLLALTPLPNNCAHRIASAFDHWALVREEARNLGERMISEVTTPDQRVHLHRRWREQLSVADELLKVAMSTLERARDLSRLRPSGEELHGPED